jgi:hypothetical protein
MGIFNCCECGKLVKDGVSGAQLSLCLGSVSLAHKNYCYYCGTKVLKQMVNAMYGANLPVTVEEKSDDRNE